MWISNTTLPRISSSPSNRLWTPSLTKANIHRRYSMAAILMTNSTTTNTKHGAILSSAHWLNSVHHSLTNKSSRQVGMCHSIVFLISNHSQPTHHIMPTIIGTAPHPPQMVPITATPLVHCSHGKWTGVSTSSNGIINPTIGRRWPSTTLDAVQDATSNPRHSRRQLHSRKEKTPK